MNKTVLIINTKDPEMKYLADHLFAHYDILEVDSCTEAFFLLEKQYQTIQVIFISISAFRENSYDFIHQHSNSILFHHIPVICIGSGHGHGEDPDELYIEVIEQGALNFFTTPVNIACIRAFLSTIDSLSIGITEGSKSVGNTNQFHIIMQNLNIGVTMATNEYDHINYTYTNDYFYSMFGYTREQFQEELGGDTYKLVVPEDLSMVRTALRTSMSTVKAIQILLKARKRDGTVINIRLHNAVHYMGTSGQISMITFFEDVTNTLKAEFRIREINEKLVNNEVFFQLDVTNQKMLEYRSIYEPFNNSQTLACTNYRDVLLSKVYTKEKQEMLNFFDFENLMASYRSGNTKFSLEYRRYMPDGDIRWFAATAILVEGTETGSVNAFIYAHDIDTKMKNRVAKDKIISTEVADIAIINIASGLCRFVSKTAYDEETKNAKPLTYEEHMEEYVGRAVAREDRDRVLDYLKLDHMIAMLSQQNSLSISFWINQPDGYNIRKNGVISYLDSTHRDILVVGRDITALFEKETEQQMALKQAVEMAEFANRAKSDFLSRMSHDMRTPLNGILGMTSLAQKEEHTPEMEGYLHNIEISGKFLLGLINDTLDLSKIESGMLELHFEEFPLEEFLAGIQTVIQPLMEERKIDFHINLQNQIRNIKVDKLRFNQIFYNLLSNAAKYTPEGGRVDFFSEKIPDRGGLSGMRFHVKDNGVGMSAMFQKTLFEPFTQEYSKAHKEQRGTGLGLAIVKQIVDMFDGVITVKSELNKGSEFIVDLYAENLDSARISKPKVEYDVSVLNGLRILFVEDNEINAMIGKELLEYQGCIVDLEMNGQAGADRFLASEIGYYDLVLTDIRMPIMNGFEEAKLIRSFEREDAKTVLIIATTADAYDDMYDKIRSAGIDERIIKPMDTNVLYETIIRLIQNRR